MQVTMLARQHWWQRCMPPGRQTPMAKSPRRAAIVHLATASSRYKSLGSAHLCVPKFHIRTTSPYPSDLSRKHWCRHYRSQNRNGRLRDHRSAAMREKHWFQCSKVAEFREALGRYPRNDTRMRAQDNGESSFQKVAGKLTFFAATAVQSQSLLPCCALLLGSTFTMKCWIMWVLTRSSHTLPSMTDCKTYDPRLWRLQWNHIKHHAGLSFGPDESNLKAQSMLRLGVASADSCTIPCNGDSNTSPSTTNTDLRLIQSLFAVKVNIELPECFMLCFLRHPLPYVSLRRLRICSCLGFLLPQAVRRSRTWQWHKTIRNIKPATLWHLCELCGGVSLRRAEVRVASDQPVQSKGRTQLSQGTCKILQVKYDYPWLMWLTIICQTMQYINQTWNT